MSGPQYIGIDCWIPWYTHEAGTFFVAGGQGSLDNYSIELWDDTATQSVPWEVVLCELAACGTLCPITQAVVTPLTYTIRNLNCAVQTVSITVSESGDPDIILAENQFNLTLPPGTIHIGTLQATLARHSPSGTSTITMTVTNSAGVQCGTATATLIVEPDSDGDHVGDTCDNCADMENPEQDDSDEDSIGNVCDICPDHPNPEQADADGDLLGDPCDVCPEDPLNVCPEALAKLKQEPPPKSPPKVVRIGPCGEEIPEAGTPGGNEAVNIDPVYLFNGEFYEEVVDLRVPGRGFDFVWARKYRSRLLFESRLAKGWDYSYAMNVWPVAEGVRVYDGNTRIDLYKPTGQPNRWSMDGFFRELTKDGPGSDATYTLHFEDGSRWIFVPLDGRAGQGMIQSIVDRYGNTMQFTYQIVNGHHLQTGITDTLGRAFAIEYTPPIHGRYYIRSLTGVGRTVTYEHYLDEDPGGMWGDLKSVTTPAVTGTPNGNDFPDGKTTVYTYSTESNPGQELDLGHNLLTIADGKGQVYLQNTYAVTKNPLDINYDRIMRQVWGDAGDIIDITYVQQTPGPENDDAVIKVIVNDRVGNVKEFWYNDRNEGIRQREYTGRANPNRPTTETENRPTGKLRQTDPDYYETCYEFNADSMPTRTIHPDGSVTRNVYELELNPGGPRQARGNLREVHHLRGPLGGDQEAIVERYEYHPGLGACCGFDFVTKEIDGRGHETTHTYDDFGNRKQTTHRIPSIVENFEYNSYGQLTAHVLPDNGSGHRRRDEYTYYPTGSQKGYLHQEIVDQGGFALTTTYEYDAAGNVVRVTDPAGKDTQFVVNALNQVVRTISREVTDGGPRYQRDVWYDANNNVVRIDVLNLDESGTLQPNTHLTTSFEYETLNQVVRKTEEVDDSRNVVTEYAYDANRNLTLTRFGEATSGRQPGNTVSTSYDERDLPFRVTRAPETPVQSTTQYDYDHAGNLVSLLEGLEDAPRQTLRAYDSYGRLVRSTDPMGNVVEYHYDANGNLGGENTPGVLHLFAVRFSGELEDVPGGVANARLSEVMYQYDAMDRRVLTAAAQFDPATQMPTGDGAVTQIGYNDASQVLSVTDDNNHTTLTTYDTANRTRTVTDPKGNRKTYTYDPAGNVTALAELERSGVEEADVTINTAFEYDNLGRLTITRDMVGNETRAGYDSRGNRTRLVDARGNVTRIAYDGLGRPLSTTHVLTDSGTGAGNQIGTIVTSQIWDDSSRLVSRTDGSGNTTLYTCDELGRVTDVRFADNTQQTTVYDVHGNAVQTTDANGTVVVAAYDLLNRETAREVTAGEGVAAATTWESFVYDGRSHLVRAADDDSLVTRAYDSLSNRINETLNGQTTSSLHDGAGNRILTSYPGGRAVVASHDALNRLESLTDASGVLATFAYDGPSRLRRREHGNGTRTDQIWNGVGSNQAGDFGSRKVRAISHQTAQAAGFSTHTLTWDRDQNKVRRQSLDAGRSDYTYDSISRLKQSTRTPNRGQPATITYTLDALGNRMSVQGATPDAGSYTLLHLFPPADRQMNQYTRTPFDKRTYDANGNLVKVEAQATGVLPGDLNQDERVDAEDVEFFKACMSGPTVPHAAGCEECDRDADGDVDLVDYADLQPELIAAALPGPPSIRYDYRNQMVSWCTTTGLQVCHTFAYDALGRRIVKIIDVPDTTHDLVTTYFYDGWRVIEEQDGQAVTMATYVYGNGIDEVLTVRRDGDQGPHTWWYHADDQGSIVAITDAAGAVVERYEYNDFGQPSIFDNQGSPLAASAVGNPVLFTGRWFDAETGLYEYRTRYYDARAGRFTTRDTIGIWGDPGNLGNGYAYVGNNPWTGVDPYGLEDMMLYMPTSEVPAAESFGPSLEAMGRSVKGLAKAVAGIRTTEDMIADVERAQRILNSSNPVDSALGEFAKQTPLSAVVDVLEWKDEYGTALSGEQFLEYVTSSGLVAIAGTAVTTRSTHGKLEGRQTCPVRPREAYNRRTHYGNTPSKSDRRAAGVGKNEVLDHDPPLVQRYYEGDPVTGEPPGHTLSAADRRASANDRSRMQPQPRQQSNQQGGLLSKYAREMRKRFGL